MATVSTMATMFREICVLGAGKMGRQIAAYFAACGCNVALLDLAADGDNPNAAVEQAMVRVLAEKPLPYFRDSDLRRIQIGNFRDNLDMLRSADLVIEVIVEELSAKIALFTQILPFLGPNTKVGTNTSGIPIGLIVEHLPKEMVPHFIGGIHFFNPVRLKLLELIFAAHVPEQERQDISAYFTSRLGKEVVQANDRPAFVANRIGMYATMYALNALERGDFNIPELEVLTGPLVGHAKSATFRTGDLVGLATLLAVTNNLFAALPQDPQRDVFQAPQFLRTLVERGDLGAEKGRGFSTKDRERGVILSLNPKTMAYESLNADGLGDLSAIAKLPTPALRIAALMEIPGRVSDFTRDYLLALLHYCAHRIPEVADDPSAIDRALRAGFAWEIGPFELWNALGAAKIAEMMKSRGLSLPEWVDTAITTSGRIPTIAPPATRSGTTIISRRDALLTDMGDNVLQFSIQSKMNTLSFEVIEALERALDELEKGSWTGLVIGDQSAENFCAGANLADVGAAIKNGQWKILESIIDRLQRVANRIYSHEKPIAGAIRGMALGGGAELALAIPLPAAYYDSFIGLVELGAGVIPAGCGSTHFAYWAARSARSQTLVDIVPFLRTAFFRIATGTVTKSAQEAVDFGFLAPGTRIVMEQDKVIAAAKEEVLRFADTDYTPRPSREKFMVLGAEGRAVLEVGIEGFLRSGGISVYDAHLARTLAYVMTGGELSGPTIVPQQYLLDLEREKFLSLLGRAETHAKMAKFA
jgi:3-hydroxyacyl-CoA dehydrogenase